MGVSDSRNFDNMKNYAKHELERLGDPEKVFNELRRGYGPNDEFLYRVMREAQRERKMERGEL